MLMGADDGGIERHILVVAIFRQSLEDTLENAALTPPSEARVGILPIAEAFREIAPRNARAIARKHGLDKEAVVCRGSANVAFTAGKKILDPFPLTAAKTTTTHGSAPQSLHHGRRGGSGASRWRQNRTRRSSSDARRSARRRDRPSAEAARPLPMPSPSPVAPLRLRRRDRGYRSAPAGRPS